MDKKSVIVNFLWKISEKGLSQFIGFAVSIVIARLIDPSAHGTLAMAMVFISILSVFVDCGLGTAVVQRKQIDSLDLSSVFYFNISMCTLIYIVVYFGAPFVSRFYENPELTAVVRAAGLIIPVSGLRSVHQAYVERNMQFKLIFLSSLLSTVVSGIVGIVMAYKGYGVWALISMSLVGGAVSTVILWLIVNWHPKWQFSWLRLKPLLNYGLKLLGSALVTSVYGNSRQLLVGKFYSDSDLAFYNKGNSLPNTISLTVQPSITSVLLPTISRYQDDRQMVQQLTEKAIAMLSMVLWPMMVGLAACAEVFIPFAMTDKWTPAVPYMQLFCVEAAIWPISAIYVNSIRAIGLSGLDLKLQTSVRIVGISLLLLMIQHGPFAVALCAFFCSTFEILLMICVSKRVLDYPIWQQMKTILPFVFMSFIMGAAVYLLGKLPINSFLLLVIQVLCGVIVYGALTLLFKRKMIQELISTFLKKKE